MGKPIVYSPELMAAASAYAKEQTATLREVLRRRHETPVHNWFGLTYANYLCIPRSALETMPVEWQRKFVAVMEEFDATGISTPVYSVQRRDSRGRFVKDEWANYRHPNIQHLLPESLRRKP